MSWHSIHVHYHDSAAHDCLILDAVRPLFDFIERHVSAAYYVRHWRRGPHLRLNLHTDADTFQDVVLPAARHIVGRFLAQRPSRAQLDADAHLAMHRRLAELEHDTGVLTPWRADNTVHAAAYDNRSGVLGGEAAVDLVSGFLSDTTGLAFAMTDHVRAGGNRLPLAFDLMIATAHGLSGAGVVGGFPSYRSHAEAFLAMWPEGQGRREVWESQYRRHSARLVQRVETVVDALSAVGPTVPFVERWVGALQTWRDHGQVLLEAGSIDLDAANPHGVDVATLAERSPYHKAVADSDWWEKVGQTLQFATWRLLLNLHYLHLTRLGITPAERFLLCHLVANAVQQCYGVSAVDVALAPRPSADPLAAWQR